MDPLALSHFLSAHEQVLPRLYASAGLRSPDALMFPGLAAADLGNGLYALLGYELFQDPTGSARFPDSNAFVTSLCLDLVDLAVLPGEKVRGRVTGCDMRLGLAAAVYTPDVIAAHLDTHSHDRGTVFAAVRHTRELRALLKPAARDVLGLDHQGLTIRYLDCVTVSDRERRDEDGAVMINTLLGLTPGEFTHAMVIPDGGRERTLMERLGFARACGKASLCLFRAAPESTTRPEVLRGEGEYTAAGATSGARTSRDTAGKPYAFA